MTKGLVALLGGCYYLLGGWAAARGGERGLRWCGGRCYNDVMRQQLQRSTPVEGLCRYVNVQPGRVHLTAEQLSAVDTPHTNTLYDEMLRFRATQRAASPSIHRMGDVMAVKLSEPGYDVSAWCMVRD